jgi:hypothetical protein
MLVTVTNTSGVTINNPITGGFGVSPDAVGGSKSFPLPYPFGHLPPMLNGASKQLPMHPADWHRKSVPWLPQSPATEWNQLVQAGVVTMATALQSGVRDQEEKFEIVVGS